MKQRLLINLLREWTQKNGRKPLVLRGARQIGKRQKMVLTQIWHPCMSLWTNIHTILQLGYVTIRFPVDNVKTRNGKQIWLGSYVIL